MPHQRVREDPAQRALLLWDRVHGACQAVEEGIVEILDRPLDAVVLQVILAEQRHPGPVVGREASLARISFPDRGRGGAAGEPAGLHGVDDPPTRKGIDHVRRVARRHHPVGADAPQRRVHDHAPHGPADAYAVRVAPGDPGVQVLARAPAVPPQRDHAEAHVRDPDALREDPGIAGRRDPAAELQVDRVRIEGDPLEHVLGAGLHVARGDPRVQPRPAAHHRLHAVRADHHPGAVDAFAVGVPHPHFPTSLARRDHPGGFRAHQHGCAVGRGLGGEKRVEAGAVKDPADVALGDPRLGAIRRDEDHARNLARHPRGALGRRKLPQPSVPHAFGAAHGTADGRIALEQHDVELRSRSLRFPCRDRARGAGADDQHVHVRHERWRARRPGRARCTCDTRCRPGGR